jgi:hypothetical protein
MENRYVINYDIKNKTVLNCSFKQGDNNSCVLEFNLTDDGEPIDLTGETISFNFLKPDQTIVIQDITTGVTVLYATEGKVQVILTSQTLAASGVVNCEIVRTLADELLTTYTFNFTVQQSIGDTGILSTNYISVVDGLVAQMNTVINGLTGAQAAELLRISDEITRVNDEAVRVIAENARELGYANMTNEIDGINSDTVTYVYNTDGSVQSSTETDINNNIVNTVAYTYINGNVATSITVINGQTVTTQFNYDGNGNIISTINTL